MKSKSFLWVLGPEDKKKSGIGLYSTNLIDGLRFRGYNIKCLFIPYKSRSLRRYLYQFFFLPLYLLFNATKYDKVFLYEEAYSFLVPFCNVVKKRSVLIFHHLPEQSLHDSVIEKLKYLYMKVILNLAKYSAILIFPSKNTKYDFLNFFSSKDDLVSKKLVVIPNCFNFSSNIRASTLANKDCYRSGVVFLYVGSEEARKNLLTSIVALSRIQYEEKITFIKIGKPIITENRAKLMEFLGTTSLNYQVSDYVSQSDLEEYFLQCDFFIMPTLHEGFGRTPIEAQSYGKIVIASDIPIMREIMGDSALYVKDPHLEASWITAFYNALKLDNEKIRLYQFKARENAARYAIENVVREFESEVLNSPQ